MSLAPVEITANNKLKAQYRITKEIAPRVSEATTSSYGVTQLQEEEDVDFVAIFNSALNDDTTTS